MRLCKYTPLDEENCLAIFDSNVPFSFAVQEREIYRRFLKELAPPCCYFVVRNADEKIVACGGIELEPANHLARLRWNMVAREFQRQNIGTFLTLSRLRLICQEPGIHVVNLSTSQRSYRFYKKMGFALQRIIPDGIAPGLDEYFMELQLDAGKRRELETSCKTGCVPVKTNC